MNITIYGTNENPLFLGKDIATILEIGNIREKTKDFDERYKTWRPFFGQRWTNIKLSILYNKRGL